MVYNFILPFNVLLRAVQDCINAASVSLGFDLGETWSSECEFFFQKI